ncbi:hypothetical protein GQ55_5G092900 [Panicum hallii var. hallii]|uniref:Uncharacterized protein n=1 Tax=Panicum hallii var. hallii TaxID=1504633 RepID=A0A2T7DEH0_9POAL|nr:hypothetical protein GQ55_5G092900 [Panicum hallii var. hallii]
MPMSLLPLPPPPLPQPAVPPPPSAPPFVHLPLTYPRPPLTWSGITPVRDQAQSPATTTPANGGAPPHHPPTADHSSPTFSSNTGEHWSFWQL